MAGELIATAAAVKAGRREFQNMVLYFSRGLVAVTKRRMIVYTSRQACATCQRILIYPICM